jgi:hypothetical protein
MVGVVSMKDAKGHGSNAHNAGIEAVPSAAYVMHKEHNEKLTAINDEHSRILDQYPKDGPMGMTPDHVRTSPEYRADKANFNRSFAALRDHNGFMVKNFKAELKAERDARRQARIK